MIQSPQGEMAPDNGLKGRLRITSDFGAYLGSRKGKALPVRPRDPERDLTAFLAGREYRVVSLAQLIIEWRRR